MENPFMYGSERCLDLGNLNTIVDNVSPEGAGPVSSSPNKLVSEDSGVPSGRHSRRHSPGSPCSVFSLVSQLQGTETNMLSERGQDTLLTIHQGGENTHPVNSQRNVESNCFQPPTSRRSPLSAPGWLIHSCGCHISLLR